MEDQIRRIKAKLRFIQDIGWRKYEHVFWAEVHKFYLRPPLEEEDIFRFEAKYNVDLPEDYRLFLMKVGNGGAGPYYGLLPLKYWFHAFDSSAKSVKDLRYDPKIHFSQECPASPDSEEGYDRIGELAWIPKWAYGTISLAEQGCLHEAFIIISGPNSGKVIYSAEMMKPFFMPDPNFISWYERWLDETLSGRKFSWFGGSGWEGNNEPYTWTPRELPDIVRNNNFYSKDELKYLPNGGYSYAF